MITGRLFDGRTSRARVVTLRLDGHVLHVEGTDASFAVDLGAVGVDDAPGATGILALPDGVRCELDTGPALEAFLRRLKHRDALVTRWERSWGLALGGVILLAAVLAGGYTVGVPWIAVRIARGLPASLVTQLGAHTLAVLDRAVFQPSQVDAGRIDRLRARVGSLRGPDGDLPGHDLQFRATRLGANAFALPGGVVIVTDDLVALGSDDEVVAVVAHELGHLHARHSLRQMLQASVVGGVTAYMLGDASGLAAGLSATVLQAKYSRDFEREADDFAARLLHANAGSARTLAKMLARLQRQAGTAGAPPGPETYLSSHPATAERIRRLRAAADG